MASSQGIKAGRAFVELGVGDKLTNGLKKAQRRLASFGRGMVELATPLLALGAVSTKVFAGFDDQMRTVQAVMGATAKEFDILTEKAKLLGRTTSFTAAQVASAMVELARAGFDATQTEAATDAVLALARATGTELAEATNIAGNALRAFTLDARDMGRVSDVMTATANNSAQTLTDLGEAMKFAAPVADDFGLSLEQTSKALGAMANFGIRGSMAGTTLRQVMLQLADPAIRNRIEALGVAVTDSAGEFRGIGQILGGLGVALKDLPGPERLAFLKDIFGKRAVSGGIKLTVSNFEKLNKAIDNAAGTAKRTAELMDAGIGGAMRMLWSAVEGAAIAIGDALAPELIALGDDLKRVVSDVSEWVAKNKTLVITIAKVAAGVLALGVASLIVGKIIGLVLGLVTAVKALGVAFAFVSANPIVGLLVATAAIVAVLASSFGDAASAARDVAKATKEASDAAAGLLAKGDEMRRADTQTIARLKQLAGVEKLTNDQMTEAGWLISEMTAAYGELGLAIDKTTGKLTGYGEAMKEVNRAKGEALSAQLAVAIEKKTAEAKALRKVFLEIRELQFGRSRPVSDSDRPSFKASKEARIAMEEAAADLAALEARLNRVTIRLETPATGGDDGSERTAVAGADGPASEGFIRKVRQLRLQAIKDAHDREIALINERYDFEVKKATEAEASKATIGKIEEARGLEIEAAKSKATESRLDEEASALEDLHALKLGQIDDEHAREIALINDTSAHEIARLKAAGATQATLDAAAETRQINLLDSVNRRNQQDAEEKKRREKEAAAEQKSIDDANLSRTERIEDLELRSKFKGLELEKKLLALEEKRATAAARAAGENVGDVEREFSLRRMILNLGDALSESADRMSIAGTFSGQSLGLLGGGSTADRIAKATEETAKNTKGLKNATGATFK